MLQKGNKKMKNHSVYIKILHLTNAKLLIITPKTTTLENKKKKNLIISKLNGCFLAYFRFFVYLCM